MLWLTQGMLSWTLLSSDCHCISRYGRITSLERTPAQKGQGSLEVECFLIICHDHVLGNVCGAFWLKKSFVFITFWKLVLYHHGPWLNHVVSCAMSKIKLCLFLQCCIVSECTFLLRQYFMLYTYNYIKVVKHYSISSCEVPLEKVIKDWYNVVKDL